MNVNEISDKETWEAFINKYSPHSLFQSWNWGETIVQVQSAKCPGLAARASKIQSFWRLGIYDNKKLIGIAQIEKVTSKKGAFLHIRHGPIFSLWKKEYFYYFLQYLKNLAKREKCYFIRLSPLIENSSQNKQLFKSLGFMDAPIHAMDGEYCWILDLDKDEATLLSQMRKTTRYLIRQAEKIGVKIVKSKQKKDMSSFLSLYHQTAKRQHFVEHKGIIEEFTQFAQDNQIMLFNSYYKKKLLAAALILFYNNQAIYHHSASIEQRIPVNYLLQWEAIKEAKARGKKFYNFWGITPDGKKRHPWFGLTLFKKGFGGELREYLHAQDFPLSPLYCTTYIIEWIRKIRKGY